LTSSAPRSFNRFAAVVLGCMAPLAAAQLKERRVATSGPVEAAVWAARLQAMADAGEIRAAQAREDTLLSDRRHQRHAQLHRGVPVWGGELVVQSARQGIVSVFGTLYEGIDLEPMPALTPAAALSVLRSHGAEPFGREGHPELVVLPLDDGRYALTFKIRARRAGLDIRLCFVDAKLGTVVMELKDLQTQAAVGTGTGVLGDRKKVSALSAGGDFVAEDRLRPPRIATFDFRGDLFRFFEVADLFREDLARDDDNAWTDAANVDAHTHAGYTYDYFFKRFGRRGLNDADIAIRSITHLVDRADIASYPDDIVSTFFLNAGYLGDGVMFYGEGLPAHLTFRGQHWDFTSGALDIVGHELTHGITDYSSRLIYRNESGALNEAFSDIMGAAVEFFFQPAGSGLLRADYLLGEDVITPGGIRSLQNPMAYGDPDHYAIRFLGSEDNGGVHTNSGIANNAFFLAVEGGTNRHSGLAVAGVGGANREQIEKVFYRAFTEMLPASASFSTARAATMQSARDLYGAGSAVEAAVTQAWRAVGVN
jgi:thermolysin